MKCFLVISNFLESESEVAQLCLTLCDPVDCNLPGSSVHGILQARIVEWVAISFSRGSSRPRDWTRVSRLAGKHFNLWATIFPILLFSSISLYCSLRKVLFLLAILWNYSGVYIFPFSFAFNFSSFLSYLWILFRQQFCLFAFLFPGDGLDHSVSCTMSWTSIHISSGTLSIRSNPLNLFVTSTI